MLISFLFLLHIVFLIKVVLIRKSVDEITIQLITDNKKIEDVKFDGIGCAISQASASMLTDKIKGMSIENIKKINKYDVLGMLHIPISSGRLKCALLSLDTLKGALELQ